MLKLNGVKCRALLDNGAGSNHATSSILSLADSKPADEGLFLVLNVWKGASLSRIDDDDSLFR